MLENNTALLILDMQMNMFADDDSVYKADEIINNITSLITKARTTNTPIIFVQNNGGEGDVDEPHTAGWELHPAVKLVKEDTIVQKQSPNAFYQTNLQQVLETKRIKKLYLAGLQTEMCVDTTCRQAWAFDYEVILINDAHTTYDTEFLTAAQVIEHHNDILGVFADICSTNEVEF